MRKALWIVVAALFLFPCAGLPQTSLTLKMISSGVGADEAPRIVHAGPGMYAVTWLRALNPNESRLSGRLVTVNGAFGSGIKNNILGTSIYRYSNYDLAALSAGGFILTGTRNTDRQIISRFFNPSFGAAGAAVASGVFGNNPSIVPAPGGFLLGEGDGYSQSFYARLDSHARKLSEPVRLNASNSANGFNVAGIRALPSGDFLILGYERNPTGSTRAASFNIPSSASSVSAIIPLEPGFAANNLGVDAAVDVAGGLSLFGHAVTDTRTNGKLRPLSAGGKPSAAPKAYPAGKTNVYARNFRIISLTGTGLFLAFWEEPAAGLIYLRLYNVQGVPIASTTTLVPDAYKYPGGIGDVAWDAQTRTLLAVWTQYGVTTDRTNIWLGYSRLSQ